MELLEPIPEGNEMYDGGAEINPNQKISPKIMIKKGSELREYQESQEDDDDFMFDRKTSLER